MGQDLIPGIISVRTSSSRLPKKCLMQFGDQNVIEHIIKRAIFFKIDPIICTSKDSTDDILVEIAKRKNIKFFRGSLLNKLKRWSDCAEYFELDFFHSIDADDPFFDGEEILRSFNLLKKGEYDAVYPTKSSSSGVGSVGFSLNSKIVKKAILFLEEDTDTEMIWNYLKNTPNIKSIILNDIILYPPKMRLTLDYEEDYWLLRTLHRIVGSYGTREDINQIFKLNPEFSSINWFNNHKWKKAQNKKNI